MASRPESRSSVQDTELCTQIVETVAEREQCDAVDLPPLYDAVDPVAVTELFASTRTSSRSVGRLTFEYCEYRITVDAQGTFTVDALE